MNPPQIASTLGPPTLDLSLPTWEDWPELVIIAAALTMIVVPLIFAVRAMDSAPTQTRAATTKRSCCCPCHTRPRSAQAPSAGAGRARIARTAARRAPSTKRRRPVDLVKKL